MSDDAYLSIVFADISSWHLSSHLCHILQPSAMEQLGYSCHSPLWGRHCNSLLRRYSTPYVHVKELHSEGPRGCSDTSLTGGPLALLPSPKLLWRAAMLVGLGYVCVELGARVDGCGSCRQFIGSCLCDCYGRKENARKVEQSRSLPEISGDYICMGTLV